MSCFVSEPPFHLTRRGWGEFPVRVQLHFKDERKKRLDIIHNLKVTVFSHNAASCDRQGIDIKTKALYTTKHAL